MGRQICSAPLFRISTFSFADIVRFPKLIFPRNESYFPELFCVIYLVSPKIKIIGCGNAGHVKKSENHENERFSEFPEVKPKSY